MNECSVHSIKRIGKVTCEKYLESHTGGYQLILGYLLILKNGGDKIKDINLQMFLEILFKAVISDLNLTSLLLLFVFWAILLTMLFSVFLI